MKAYSADLRERVLPAIDQGIPRGEIVRVLGVSPATIGRYLKQCRETGMSIPKRSQEQRLWPTHPDTQDIKKDYATFLHIMGRDGEAKKLEEGL